MEQVLFKCCRDGRLAGSAQTSEPDGTALLAEKGISLVLGDGSGVEGDVCGHFFLFMGCELKWRKGCRTTLRQ